MVHIDPPWRIKGGQRNNSSFMFSNNRFNLNYSTMSNHEIMNIPVETLSRKGFCFLWILNSQMDVGYQCMEKWGYQVVDQITWIKTKNEKLTLRMTMPKKKKKMGRMTKVMIRKPDPTQNSKPQMSKTLTMIMTKDSSN